MPVTTADIQYLENYAGYNLKDMRKIKKDIQEYISTTSKNIDSLIKVIPTNSDGQKLTKGIDQLLYQNKLYMQIMKKILAKNDTTEITKEVETILDGSTKQSESLYLKLEKTFNRNINKINKRFLINEQRINSFNKHQNSNIESINKNLDNSKTQLDDLRLSLHGSIEDVLKKHNMRISSIVREINGEFKKGGKYKKELINTINNMNIEAVSQLEAINVKQNQELNSIGQRVAKIEDIINTTEQKRTKVDKPKKQSTSVKKPKKPKERTHQIDIFLNSKSQDKNTRVKRKQDFLDDEFVQDFNIKNLLLRKLVKKFTKKPLTRPVTVNKYKGIVLKSETLEQPLKKPKQEKRKPITYKRYREVDLLEFGISWLLKKTMPKKIETPTPPPIPENKPSEVDLKSEDQNMKKLLIETQQNTRTMSRRVRKQAKQELPSIKQKEQKPSVVKRTPKNIKRSNNKGINLNDQRYGLNKSQTNIQVPKKRSKKQQNIQQVVNPPVQKEPTIEKVVIPPSRPININKQLPDPIEQNTKEINVRLNQVQETKQGIQKQHDQLIKDYETQGKKPAIDAHSLVNQVTDLIKPLHKLPTPPPKNIVKQTPEPSIKKPRFSQPIKTSAQTMKKETVSKLLNDNFKEQFTSNMYKRIDQLKAIMKNINIVIKTDDVPTDKDPQNLIVNYSPITSIQQSVGQGQQQTGASTSSQFTQVASGIVSSAIKKRFK